MAPIATADTVQAARKRFFLEGSSPEGLVAAPILRSWQRCSSQGLDAGERPQVEPMSSAALRGEQERHDLLRRITRPEMMALRQEAKLTDSVVILTDGDGLVLEMTGNPEFAGRASRVALRPGVAWNEAAIGTNAIGTALIERRPIGVHGAEHFFEPHRILTCAAAPIFDPRGKLAGVLDMSGHASVRPVHALGLVRLAVEQIEYRLFERGFEHFTVLRFHEEAELVGTAREAVLVFDGDRLVGGNRRALGLMKLDWTAIDSVRMPELFEAVDVSDEVKAIRSRTGVILHGRLAPPREAVASPPRQGPRPAAPAAEPVFDAATLAALDRAVRLVDAEVPVLVHGETGAGKEVFARRVHAHGSRRDGPFVAVNCAALPESLIEAELFGYEEGAFTGAHKQGRSGLVRQAEGGILFLDEIGDMPLAAQGRLLRLLQERQVVPLGGGAPVPVDFALLCATHRPLAALVESGGFRSDLYFRIAQYVVELPSLRAMPDRRGVIRTLWRGLGGDLAGVSLTEETLAPLAAYGWPGNFRQLAGMLRALLALAEPGQPLPLAALPPELVSPRRGPERAADAPPVAVASDGSLSALTLEAMARTVEECGGNISRAAKKLGIDRSTLYRRLIWQRGGPETRRAS